MTASFEYKCRRCGEIELNPHCGHVLAQTELIKAVVGIKSEQAMAPTLLSTHCCKDGGQGISDLQGYRVEEPPQETKEDSETASNNRMDKMPK